MSSLLRSYNKASWSDRTHLDTTLPPILLATLLSLNPSIIKSSQGVTSDAVMEFTVQGAWAIRFLPVDVQTEAGESIMS